MSLLALTLFLATTLAQGNPPAALSSLLSSLSSFQTASPGVNPWIFTSPEEYTSLFNSLQSAGLIPSTITAPLPWPTASDLYSPGSGPWIPFGPGGHPGGPGKPPGYWGGSTGCGPWGPNNWGPWTDWSTRSDWRTNAPWTKWWGGDTCPGTDWPGWTEGEWRTSAPWTGWESCTAVTTGTSVFTTTGVGGTPTVGTAFAVRVASAESVETGAAGNGGNGNVNGGGNGDGGGNGEGDAGTAAQGKGPHGAANPVVTVAPALAGAAAAVMGVMVVL
ncbi:uncharacterized protein EI97DRAFT_458397 [Westerdykella ornata]|uniref:Uncharacterized protein n=1 Tax=Westerdykella ornata TaxID=318751 RepID=A0A6A6JJ28_WESOR|nr:uncharacterized protein EI97DRAFT_458397 [Westerdykella ornata]KAF2276467.1 hypothetical protein EI97DRAFT_458397 [Westerdykella ornata]